MAGKPVDLFGTEEINIDYTSMKVDDISKRGSVRSYQFKLPKTANNRLVFENPDFITSTSQFRYNRQDARLINNGIDLGILFMELYSSSDTYNINLYGSTAEIFGKLKDLKLTDLDYYEWNHWYTFYEVNISRFNTEGYIYPIVDYAISSSVITPYTTRVVNPRFMLPSMFADTVIEAIGKAIGYTIQNDLLEDDNYTSAPLLIPATGRAELGLVDMKRRYEITTASTSNVSINNVDFNIIGMDSIVEYDGDYFFPFYITDTVVSGLGMLMQDSLRGDVEINFSISNGGAFTHTCEVRIWEAASGLYLILGTVSCPVGISSHTVTGLFSFDNSGNNTKPQFSVVMGSDIGLVVQSGATIKISNIELLHEKEIQFIVAQSSPSPPLVRYPDYVEMQQYMPDMLVSDFLKDYMNMYNLLPVLNEQSKTLRLRKFDSLEDNISSALDWSDKLDFTDEPEIKYTIDKFAQVNKFTWEQDGEEVQPYGTNGELEISNKNLELEKDIVKLDFSSTYSVNRLLGMDIPHIGVIDDFGEYTEKKNPRLLLLDLKDVTDYADTTAFTYSDAPFSGPLNITTGIPVARFIADGETYNLGFKYSLLYLFYGAMANVLRNAIFVNCRLRLTDIDINTLDFFRPVFISHFNAYFYISQIKGYNATGNESTEVELVKLF